MILSITCVQVALCVIFGKIELRSIDFESSWRANNQGDWSQKDTRLRTLFMTSKYKN